MNRLLYISRFGPIRRFSRTNRSFNRFNHYTSLGSNKNASTDEVKSAFRKLSKKYHPDVAEDSDLARKKWLEILNAYEILGDTTKRKDYDIQMKFREPSAEEVFGKQEVDPRMARMYRQRRAEETWHDDDESWQEKKAWPFFAAIIVFIACAPMWIVMTTAKTKNRKPHAGDFKNPNREFAHEISQIERGLNPFLLDPKHEATSSSAAKKYSSRNQRIIEAAEAAGVRETERKNVLFEDMATTERMLQRNNILKKYEK